MRNLKKILALVLALVMSFSVMTVASASFKDASTIDSKYATAVDALAALEVFKGYEDGSFNPKGAITRAEVAAIIYRIDTSDIYDKQVKIYADYNKFDDVASTAWYAGYVNYCANALYVKGYDETTFGPNDKVTGYQVLAMILRVVGYDQNNEFSGNAWQIEVAKYAQKLGVTANVTADTLGAPATRELVAELLYRTIVGVRQVDYTLAFGYSEYANFDKTVLNKTIEQEKIGMYVTDATGTIYLRDRYNALVPNKAEFDDIWGRPFCYWVAPLWTKDTLADWSEAPLATYTEAVVECELATVIGLKTAAEGEDFPVVVNGVYTKDDINPLHTNNHKNEYMIGEQGTLMEVYSDRIVLVDTYLAKVTKTVEQKTDKAGHVKVPATNDIEVYNNYSMNVNGVLAGEAFTISGNNYATGEYLLVNVYEGELAYNEDSALYANAVANGVASYRLFINGNPDEITAKQTKIWWNAEKHTIDEQTYLDNVNYLLDAAEYDKTTAYRWFFDENGYVIGSAKVAPVAVAKSYAVVLAAQWMNSGVFGENGYAYGKVQYLDGTEPVLTKLAGFWDGETLDAKGNMVINKFRYGWAMEGTFQEGILHTTAQYNVNTYAHLYEVIETSAGLVLVEVGPDLDATLNKGVSNITGTDYYTDNETVYVFYNGETKALDFVKGYDNAALAKEFYVYGADILDGEFAIDYIYIPEYELPEDEEKDVTGYGYYYITNEAFNYTLKKNFAVFGVVDAAGNTDPLLFAKDWKGSEMATEMYLEMFVAENLNKLFLVELKNGVVVDMVEVDDIAAGKDDKGTWKSAMFVAAGDYEFIDTGVLKVYEGNEIRVALNVNAKTFIYNIDGEGSVDTILDLEENDLYVVYSGTNAVTIFVVPTEDGI